MVPTIGKPVSFRCGSCLLYGTLHYPPYETPLADTGIILLNPGPTDRSGPHRLYVKLSTILSAQGYPVLRFDARGVGESEGEWDDGIEGATVLELWKKIQLGVWVPDTFAAIDFMLKKVPGVKRVILGGLCGGAITALLAGSKHPLVEGLLMMGTPITLADRTANVEDLPEETIRKETRQLFRKFLSPSAWFRFLTFETDYRTNMTILRVRVRRTIGTNGKIRNNGACGKLNPHFLDCFKVASESAKRMIFVYAENDYLWHEFKEYFLAVNQQTALSPFKLATIQKSNHNMTEDVWQEQLFHIVTHWLTEYFNSPHLEVDQKIP